MKGTRTVRRGLERLVAENKGNELHGLLDTLLSTELTPQEKEKIIYDDYGIESTVEL